MPVTVRIAGWQHHADARVLMDHLGGECQFITFSRHLDPKQQRRVVHPGIAARAVRFGWVRPPAFSRDDVLFPVAIDIEKLNRVKLAYNQSAGRCRVFFG